LKKAGLYIHFPFCRRACFYCHFFKKKYDQDLVEQYGKYLLKEIRLRKNNELILETVYVGGGSPSLLKTGQLHSILESVTQNFQLTANAEITMEANPEDITKEKLKAIHSLGINRLSIGVQSFQERDLRCLKRTHSAAQAILAMEMALDAGFTNFSIDLIIGLESQTPHSLEKNFEIIEQNKPAHVSVYILEGVQRPEADNRDAHLYEHTRKNLLAIGYQHYEVSNYCRPGKSSRHNLKYWQNKPYIALGPSAAGFLDGRDYRNYSDLKKYYAALDQGILPEQKTKQMDPARRRIITGLRLFDGIPASVFKPFPAPTDFLLAEGFLVKRTRNLAVPPEKILLLNEILGYFI
jgi:oxygen-independent coproporphyrinogen-3 oxidase